MLNPTQPRTATTLRAAVAPPASRRGVSALTSLYLGLQDLAFEALTELRYGLDRLCQAARYDDQETAIEQAEWARMRRCGCRCCGISLAAWLASDTFDKRERFDGWAIAAVHGEAAGGYVRASSTQIEAGRPLVVAQTRREGPDGGAA